MEILFSDNKTEKTSLIIDEAANILHLKGQQTGDVYYDIQFPFKFSKIRPQFRNVNESMETVLVFRNEYYSQNDIIELRKGQGEEKKRIGLMFKPSLIFEPDLNYVYKDDLHLRTSILRSFGNLFRNEASLKSGAIPVKRETNFVFADFFPEDIIVAVIPNVWYPDFNQSDLSELLINLYSYGFYLLNSTKDADLKIPKQNLQKAKFESLSPRIVNSRKYLDIITVSKKVKHNKYCNFYLEKTIKQSNNALAKFYQAYGLVEIFKDEVLKQEIKSKLSDQDDDFNSLTGHKIHRRVLEISKDNYTVEKLFGKYHAGPHDMLDNLFLELSYFLETCREKTEIDTLNDFPQIFYFFRNIMVHDIQFLFTGDEGKVLRIHRELERIVQEIEYVILDTLKFLRLN